LIESGYNNNFLGDLSHPCVMITGANGFVGQALCSESIRRGFRIKCATRSIVKLPSNIEAMVVGIIDGGTEWSDSLLGVDVVIHLAARVHVMNEAAADPLAEFSRINLHGTANLARQAAHAGVKRFVYVSSIGVNGNRTDGMQAFSERDTPHPHNAYALSKWLAEQALWEIALETGLEIVIMRPPLIYGPAVKGNFLKLLAAIDKGFPLPLRGAVSKRSLVYLGNLVDALITCATHPAAAGQTYLICDGEDISSAALTGKIARELGRNNHSFYLPLFLLRVAAIMLKRSSQIDQLFGSLRINDEKIRRELFWTPPFTIDQGLHETIDWYRKSKVA